MSRETKATRIVGLLAVLAAVWLLWSGIYKPLLLWLGAFSCVLTAYLAYRVGFFRQASGLHVLPKLPGYWLWLLSEIAKSSIEVARVVLSPKLPISPTIAYLDAEPEGPIGQVILSNAVTLSPGTVTLDVFESKLCVHCLTREAAKALANGEANRRTAELTSR